QKVIFCFYKLSEFVNLLEYAKSHSHLVFSPSLRLKKMELFLPRELKCVFPPTLLG
ncbi:unnamed protein product, partial [Arabidopsis halleri]